MIFFRPSPVSCLAEDMVSAGEGDEIRLAPLWGSALWSTDDTSVLHSTSSPSMQQKSRPYLADIAPPIAWEEHSFLVGPCPKCQRRVVAAKELIGDNLVDVCSHCEAPLDYDECDWAGPQEVVDLGYFIDGFQGAGCGSDGGCRDGACGVKQPG